IGKQLNIEKIKAGIPRLVKTLSKTGIAKAKQAIMTTDKFPKELTVQFSIGGRKITVCGVAKGCGMISPDMATMLAYVFTDARITDAALKQALTEAVEVSFNSITVDGCMSTNDTVIAMANGAAGNKPITQGKDLAAFKKALAIVCLHLAKEMVRDGEGATKLIQITVNGAASPNEAKKAALAVANSNLFKAAMYGANPNFGRVVQALGTTGIAIRQEKLKIKLGDLNKKEVKVSVALGRGIQSATVYASDLSPEYIKINAAYN
ncbi:MAG: bifunctional ornithine acetyltransferase/N-acetylglutamate synthase, partial [Candidatus Omnitrophica bacterium]|nr:bifunctional ornithine acetyltransferase/N-acetylglutamate synthase [Candidatus Omnitrophota bacterium]